MLPTTAGTSLSCQAWRMFEEKVDLLLGVLRIVRSTSARNLRVAVVGRSHSLLLVPTFCEFTTSQRKVKQEDL